MQRRMSKIERTMFKKQHMEDVQQGSGLYVFENNTKGTLMLPRSTKSGKKEVEAVNPKIPGSGQFQGDSYYLSMVKDNLLKLVRVIDPATPAAKKVIGENTPEYKSVEKVQQGKGLFLYENNTKGTLILPKPTKTGVRMVSPVDPKRPGSGRFQGDDYYMSLVKGNALRLIQVFRTSEQEDIMSQDKLILDQPEIVTTEGVVEHVVKGEDEMVTENQTEEQQQDVLLNENPMDDIEFLDN